MDRSRRYPLDGMRSTLEEQAGSREPDRRVMGRLWLAAVVCLVLAVSAAALAMLWPNRAPGGEPVAAGRLSEIYRYIQTQELPLYLKEHHVFLVPYAPAGDRDPYGDVAEAGLMALSARSPHLGDLIVYCQRSGLFEDPRGHSKFNLWGEVLPGSPAPHGMWRYPIEVTEDGWVFVDTATVLQAPTWGPNTLPTESAPHHCWAPSPTGDGIVHGR